MLNADEITELVGEMAEARFANDQPHLTRLIEELVTGPQGDTLNVVLTLAGTLALDLGDNPKDGFYRLTITHIDPEGHAREGSADDLPAHVATFFRMVIAVAGGDLEMARDLFLGYVEKRGERAVLILILALDEVLHANGACPACAAEEEVRDEA